MKEFFKKIWTWIKGHILETITIVGTMLAVVLIFSAAKVLENDDHHLYAFVTFLGGVSVFYQGLMLILNSLNDD